MLPPGLRPRLRAILLWTALLACLCLLPPPARAADGPTPGQVAQAIALRRSRVAEFQVIRQAAEELGFRVWLFGGTAAGFAHYVRSDLAREGGDERYRQSFFDYDFTSVYRSTQDADLVVDATPEQAEQLESLIRRKMSFLQGSKEHWEVRLLRHERTSRGGQVKQALLANPDFLGQHTDSNSTGMIELTSPPQGEGVVRDLRDWESDEPFFLQDVTSGRLHFYQSPTHRQTSRFLQGDNPPLFSVIRYLVKAFQYGLTVDGDDLRAVKAIIDAFDPGRDYQAMSPWARGWLERYGVNLIRHAVDVEYAWNTLQGLGLRETLISLSSPSEAGSLGWWLSREPLRTGELGQGGGKTARELGITTVAHETRDFLAYESLTRDVTGRPNVLISRPDRPGESATLGPGFYTRLGREGARGTGLTIRFQVDPEAREGEDFTVRGEVVLFTNRTALTVIPESLDLSFPGYLEMLREGRFDPADLGLWMKLQRRLRLQPLSEEDERRAVEIASGMAGQETPWYPLVAKFLSAWLDHPLARKHPQVMDRFADLVLKAIQRGDQAPGDLLPLLAVWFDDPASERHPEVEERLTRIMAARVQHRVAETRAFEALKARDLFFEARQRMFSRGPEAPENHEPELPDPLPMWFSLPVSTRHPELVEALLEGDCDEFVVQKVLSQRGEWADHPELLRKVIARNRVEPGDVVRFILYKPEWAAHPELFQSYFNRPDHPVDMEVASILSGQMPTWLDQAEVVGALIAHTSWGSFQSDWGAKKSRDVEALAQLLKRPRWKGHPELVRALIEALPRRFESFYVVGFALRGLLREPQWAGHPELVLAWLRHTDRSWDAEIDLHLEMEPVRSDPTLSRLCGGEPVSAACLRGALQEGSREAELAQEILAALRSSQLAEEGCR